MKLMFLAGSLEPGRDGVGDYARRLAGELVRTGMPCELVAIEERDQIEPVREEEQHAEGTVLRVRRLSARTSWRARGKILREIVASWQPDWISLQWVPYAYDSRGLPFAAVAEFSRVSRQTSTKWQVMFHELWIGGDQGDSLRHRLVGRVQRWLTRRLVSTVNPRIVHTQMRLWRDLLRAEGVEAEVLPLFGNIPVVEPDPAYLLPFNREDRYVVVHFGRMQPLSEAFSQALDELGTWIRSHGKQPVLVAIGRSGHNAAQVLDVTRNKWGEEAVVDLGEREPEEISRVFQASDLGISRVPLAYLEKSGTAMAMLEHGLRVFAPTREPLEKNARRSALLEDGRVALRVALLNETVARPADDRSVGAVARMLAASLPATDQNPALVR